MRKSSAAFVISGLALGVVITYASHAIAADTHVIKATGTPAWTSGGKSSKTDGTPLVIDLKIGDVIDIQVPPGIPPHGAITIKQLANVQPPSANEITDPVLACGEDKSTKPNAVLREIECGTPPKSQFGIKYKGSMKLEVMDTFKNDVNLWCVVHHFSMTGTLKLKP